MNSRNSAGALAFCGLSFCLCLLLTGCEGLKSISLTGQMWDGDLVINRCDPSTNANLRLFDKPDHSDVLVVYSEARESTGATRSRAYFLFANEWTISARQHPHFVSTNVFAGLGSIPVRRLGRATPKTGPIDCAWLFEDGRSFTLVRDGKELGPFRLPTYQTRSSEVERVVLTPATVAVDGTVVGTLVAYVAASIYASANGFKR